MRSRMREPATWVLVELMAPMVVLLLALLAGAGVAQWWIERYGLGGVIVTVLLLAGVGGFIAFLAVTELLGAYLAVRELQRRDCPNGHQPDSAFRQDPPQPCRECRIRERRKRARSRRHPT